MNRYKNFKAANIFLFILIFMNFGDKAKSQIIQFSQFYSNPTIISPSFTGLIPGSRIAINYRDQWPSLPGSFTTTALTYDHYFDNLHSGFGLSIIRDQAGAGPLANTSFGALYSFDFNINREWHLRPGIKFGYAQRTLDFQRLTLGDQLVLDGDNNETSIEVPPDDIKPYLDATASVIAYNEVFWGGVTFDHLMRPNESLKGEITRKPLLFYLYGGYKIPLGPRRSRFEESVRFAFNYRIQQKFDQLDVGFYYTKEPLVLGAWFRGIPLITEESGYKYEEIDALVLLIGYKIGNFSLGYSYDFTISQLMTHSGGSHEISLVYEFNRDLRLERRRKRMPIPCPRF